MQNTELLQNTQLTQNTEQIQNNLMSGKHNFNQLSKYRNHYTSPNVCHLLSI